MDVYYPAAGSKLCRCREVETKEHFVLLSYFLCPTYSLKELLFFLNRNLAPPLHRLLCDVCTIEQLKHLLFQPSASTILKPSFFLCMFYSVFKKKSFPLC